MVLSKIMSCKFYVHDINNYDKNYMPLLVLLKLLLKHFNYIFLYLFLTVFINLLNFLNFFSIKHICANHILVLIDIVVDKRVVKCLTAGPFQKRFSRIGMNL